MLSFNYFLLHTPKILAGIVCFCPINMSFIHEQFILIFFLKTSEQARHLYNTRLGCKWEWGEAYT